jgi:hypothetical protein
VYHGSAMRSSALREGEREILHTSLGYTGPQVITGRAGEAVVVLSYAEYRKLLMNQQKLSGFFHESPLAEAELDLTRDTSDPRADIDRQ